jgi:5-formyltetrahydrofolate cyclo-ligase
VIREKRITRQKFKSLRMGLSRDEVLRKSALIKKSLFGLPEFARARTIAFYVAKKSNNEVETEEMIRESLAVGKRVLVPVVDKASGKILFHELQDYDSELSPGAYGIPEPKPACRRIVRASESEVVIVPGLAFDLQGHRLGYGGGYYDRLLRELTSRRPSPLFIGLAYEFQVVDRLPRTHRDVPVDILVTEKRVLHF